MVSITSAYIDLSFYSPYCLFLPSPPHSPWSRQLCSICNEPVHATPFLFSCHQVEIAELFLYFRFHCKFMCIDRSAIWPQLCGLKLLSRPADLLWALNTSCMGRIRSRFLADAVSMPEANLPYTSLSKHEHCEQRDPRGLPSAPRDCGHMGIWLNTVWGMFKYGKRL